MSAPEPKTYCFDIDGTLCSNTWGEYESAEPFLHMIAQVNALHAAGDRILLFTARGTTTGTDWRSVTEGQLARWSVKYHELIFGKPQADFYIDDRGMSLQEWDTRRPPVTKRGAAPNAPGDGGVPGISPASDQR